MFALIDQQAPRIDATFLFKPNADSRIREQGPQDLYKLARYLHFKHICATVVRPEDHAYAVVATIRLARKAQAARDALAEVCSQLNRDITLCFWDASSSWGLQVADYALWAVHRRLRGQPLTVYDDQIAPHVQSVFTPWGRET